MSHFLTKSLLVGAFVTIAPITPAAYAAEAIFAGGCFWCIEKDFEHVVGVTEVVSGYSGGKNENPTYKNHVQHGHREVVKITYDPDKTNYETLLKIFWRSVDPTDGGGQFCDRGHSYTTAVYAIDGEQLELAKKSKEEIAGILKQPIATEITMVAPFTAAEGYHQDYYKKNSLRYGYYRRACGRDAKVKALWGKEAYQGIDKSS